MSDFSERLKELMRRAGIGQEDLAEQLGVTQVTISRYVRGATEPRVSELQKLAGYFQISVEDLIGPPDGVLEFRDHEPEQDYQIQTTAEEALEKILRRNKTLHETLRQAIVAVERWDAQQRKRKRKR